MTKQEFRNLINHGAVILDGATGTNLQKAGMPGNVCPEQWILDHPDVMRDLSRSYVQAGARIIYAPTFTANRIKLAEYGLQDQLEQMNTRLVRLAKEAADGAAYVAGDLTMTGQQLYPQGDLQFEQLVQIYKEQAGVLYEAGVDLFVIETMMSLQETRAAVFAIQEVCPLPIMASLTFEADGRTLFGTNPQTAVIVLQGIGVDAVGLNCSAGPLEMVEIVEEMYAYANVPILAKPNAGLPQLEDGKTVYKTSPQEFAEAGRKLVEAGAAIVGGCCGTTPAHIQALAEAAKDLKCREIRTERRRVLTSERKVTEIIPNGSFQVVGERINPTGKKKLQAQLREGNLELVRTMAREQEENGAAILDINMGMNGIDEKKMMIEAVYEVTTAVDCPLCIDSSYIEVIEAALRIYPGRVLINSISLEKDKFERLLPIARRYGAMFILLPLSDQGLPKTEEEKRKIVHTILERAYSLGFVKEDIVVDGLVATVGANPKAALECFDTIRYCSRELGLATICGLSNISFGLPERLFVNTAFLSMAIANGLSMAIANPSQDLLMNAAAAADLLMNKEGGDLAYINRIQSYQQKTEREKQEQAKRLPENGAENQTKTAQTADSGNLSQSESASDVKETIRANAVYRAVLHGEKNSIVSYAEEELSHGHRPEQIIDQYLIPAINEVG